LITFDTSELDDLTNLLRWRAQNYVPDAMVEGRAAAERYAAAGGRKNAPSTRLYYATLQRRRARRATGALIARMTERVLYITFLKFFSREF
jgi:hypothetical protein